MPHLKSGSEARRSVGVIGLGQMGRGIAANLDRAGLLRAVFDMLGKAALDRRLQRSHHRETVKRSSRSGSGRTGWIASRPSGARNDEVRGALAMTL